MNRIVVVTSLFGAALVSCLIFLTISEATVVPLVARGTGPDGVHVTMSGWMSWILSILSTGGFTLAGLMTSLAGRFGVHVPNGSSKTLSAEIIELIASFVALMNDRSNRAFQRRFFFALVDSANLIQGCETFHDAGVVTIRYRGYADPVTIGREGEPAC